MTERDIVIGLIMSTEYLKSIQSVWDIRIFESVAAKRLAGWTWSYYEQYAVSPQRDIIPLCHERIKTDRIPADVADEIEQEILPTLLAEFDTKEPNITYLVDETVKYIKERKLLLHVETVKGLVTAGRLEEAEQLVTEYRAIGNTAVGVDQFIRSLSQIRKNKCNNPTMLMYPWLREGQTTILYGGYGTGKSLLSIAVCYTLGLSDYTGTDCEFSEWQVKHPSGTLYIDGELGEKEMEERVSQFEWLGTQHGLYRMRVLSIPEYQLATEDPFYLSSRVNQLKILRWLQDHPNYKIITLDSISTLFGLEEENSNSEWNNKVNPFLRDLRALGVAQLLLHHAGKDNKKGLRGASAMGAMAHNIFRLVNHPQKRIDDGEAWFTVLKDKQRAGGHSFKTFSLHFAQENNDSETHWETTDND